MRSLAEGLYIVELAAVGVLLLRLALSGLYKSYILFVVYLGAQVVFGAAGILLNSIGYGDGYIYASLFVAFETLDIVLSLLILLGLFALVLKDLPGMVTIARRYLTLALCASIVISLLLLGIERFSRNLLEQFFVLDRALNTSLLVFILCIAAFLLYFPIPLSRNVIAYTVGFAIYFCCKSAALFIRTSGFSESWNEALSNVLLCTSTACLVYWIFSLTRAGEAKLRESSKRWSPQEQALVMGKLRSLNAGFVRAAKK